MGAGHDRKESFELQYVDSAATTALASAASSRAHSFDGGERDGKRCADIELERWVQRQKKEDALNEDALNEDAYEHAEAGTEGEEATGLLTPEDGIAQTLVDPPLPPDPEQAAPPLPPGSAKTQQASWSSLPHKSQLAVLTLARLSEPLIQTSLQSYMFYQLKSFHGIHQPPPSDSTVAAQAGTLAASFAGSQMLTAVLWGRAADSELLGRKKVILIGLFGTAVGCLGFGFSRSFGEAVFWRCIGGALNGNIGVMRTMISEIVKERRFLTRAFLLLPMCFNIGVIVGPLLGGLLADPVGSYPEIFPEGYQGWMTRFPYALPNVVLSAFLVASALGVVFCLEETLEGLRDKPDFGVRLTRWVARVIFRRRPRQEYAHLASTEAAAEDVEMGVPTAPTKAATAPVRRRLPLRRIWTSNLIFTLLSHGLLAMHVGTFNNLWFVFLSTPRYAPNTSNNDGDSKTLHVPTNYHPHAPFTFTGGLALPPRSIGSALAIMGLIGITLQVLLYPRISFKLGMLRSFKISILLFPVAYMLAPYLSLLPSSSPPPSQATGAIIWMGITALLFIQVTARTFALPSTAILVNNACPHPSVLGTVHGIGQTVSSATRTIGPALAGWIYGKGLERGVVGLAWWYMAGVAICGAVAGRWVRDGSGHEVFLDGEEEEKAKG